MSSYKVAVPSNNPGGMEASRSDHFGHSDLFTLLEIEDDKIVGISTHENVAHSSGGRLMPRWAFAAAPMRAWAVAFTRRHGRRLRHAVVSMAPACARGQSWQSTCAAVADTMLSSFGSGTSASTRILGSIGWL